MLARSVYSFVDFSLPPTTNWTFFSTLFILKTIDDSTPPISPPLPGLAQSSSNSSSSPPEPSTPPPPHTRIISRSRTRNRYPNDLGRVPLHRRGTSKTYEALEDLLREAGYKETRIFTPETDRSEGRDDASGTKGGDDSRMSVVKDGMEAVVGFFAGLLPSAAASKTSLVSSANTLEPSNSTGNGSTSESATAHPEPLTASPQEYSPPASPSPLPGAGAQRYANQQHANSSSSLRQQAGRRSFDMTEPPTPTTASSSNLTSSVDSLNRAGDPTPKAARSTTRPGHSAASGYQYHMAPLQTAGRPSVQRTPSHLSADHHSLQRPSSRSSMSRPGSSQGRYPYQAQGPSGSVNGMPPSSSQSRSQSRPHAHRQPTPLTQSNLSQLHQHQQQQRHHPHHHDSSYSPIESPRPSRASAYLRHVASIPTLPAPPTSRPSSAPVGFFSSKFSSLTRRSGRQLNVSLNDKDSEGEYGDGPPSVYYRSGTGEEDEDERAVRRLQPPMPPSWLETVARAVLFGGGSVGGPAHRSSSPSSVAVTSASAGAATRGTPNRSSSHAFLHQPHAHHLRQQVLRPMRSSLSQVSHASHTSQTSKKSARSQLSDQTNLTNPNGTASSSNAFLSPPPLPHTPLPLNPPALFAKLERGRAGRSESQVYTTRVICRSAPGSRSGSVARSGGGGSTGGRRDASGGGRVVDLPLNLNLGLGLTSGNNNKNKRKKKGGGEEVPMLARTRAEGDILWSSSESKSRRKMRKTRSRSRDRRTRSEHHRRSHKHPAHRPQIGEDAQSRFTSTSEWNAESDLDSDLEGGDYSSECSSYSEDYDEEEEDEGELDLARILVPPKRQNSIRSLRKHLVGSAGLPARPASRGSGSSPTSRGPDGSPIPPVPPLPLPSPLSGSSSPLISASTTGKGAAENHGNGNAIASASASGRSTPNLPFRKPFRTTSLQSSEWDEQDHHSRERGGDYFERWSPSLGKGTEDDDEHDRMRMRGSFVGFEAQAQRGS
ncbi:hypothetical protein CPB84DRAFT_1959877 [Gymnopilus junonius]|uniref:Uncharacterized protein n=1 Tax=Gymnopilus junonius TaxID=109634 RepID=A0A9P5NUH7_GYMJU|nr:hypothetical protein CPB84DRAFT_1959877 [Gymnopilus junonius]